MKKPKVPAPAPEVAPTPAPRGPSYTYSSNPPETVKLRLGDVVAQIPSGALASSFDGDRVVELACSEVFSGPVPRISLVRLAEIAPDCLIAGGAPQAQIRLPAARLASNYHLVITRTLVEEPVVAELPATTPAEESTPPPEFKSFEPPAQVGPARPVWREPDATEPVPPPAPIVPPPAAATEAAPAEPVKAAPSPVPAPVNITPSARVVVIPPPPVTDSQPVRADSQLIPPRPMPRGTILPKERGRPVFPLFRRKEPSETPAEPATPPPAVVVPTPAEPAEPIIPAPVSFQPAVPAEPATTPAADIPPPPVAPPMPEPVLQPAPTPPAPAPESPVSKELPASVLPPPPAPVAVPPAAEIPAPPAPAPEEEVALPTPAQPETVPDTAPEPSIARPASELPPPPPTAPATPEPPTAVFVETEHLPNTTTQAATGQLPEQDALQAVFMTEEYLSVERVVELCGALPGIKSCLLTRNASVLASHNVPESIDLVSLSAHAVEMLNAMRTSAAKMGVGAVPAVTIHSAKGPITFFQEADICLLVLHKDRGFVPGVREKLQTVVNELVHSKVPLPVPPPRPHLSSKLGEF